MVRAVVDGARVCGHSLRDGYAQVEHWFNPMTNAIVGAIVLVYLYRVVTWRRVVENDDPVQGNSTERRTQATSPSAATLPIQRATNQSRRLASGDCSLIGQAAVGSPATTTSNR